MSQGETRPPRPSPDDPPDPYLGRTIAGKFVLDARIGTGAMGIVYRARQAALDKVVAIKVMRREHALDESFALRFAREARAAARLDHPNSIRVFDFGVEPDGLLYIAMEYIEGVDLAEVLTAQGALPAHQIRHILGQTLAALAMAHDVGVLHRDIKPENIRLQSGRDDFGIRADTVKVCDFGIAKIAESAPASSLEKGRRELTVGLVVGTPAYMSPEQARGNALDARSDLYSVGIVCYQMLTGRVPFLADTALGIVLKQVSEEPIPPSAHAAVDPALEVFCLRALRKDPAERYQSARQMSAALREGSGLHSPIPSASTPIAESAPGREPTSPPQAVQTHAVGAPLVQPTLGGITPSVAPVAARRLRPLAYAAGAVVIAVALVSMRAIMRKPPLAVVEAPARIVPTGELTPSPVRPPASLSTLELPPAPVEEPSPAPTPTHVAPSHAVPVATVLAVREAPSPTLPGPPSTGSGVESQASASPEIASAPAELLVAPAPPAVQPPVAVAAAPPAPAFDLASARVELRAVANVSGATTSAVNRAVAGIEPNMTACYRAALPQLEGTREGPATLAIETDGAGVIIGARLAAPFSDSRLAACVARAVRARRIADVDTGSARADVQLVFRAR